MAPARLVGRPRPDRRVPVPHHLFTARLKQALKTILASSASPVERAVALRLVEGLVALRLSLLRPAEAACARADRQAGCCCACAQPEARCAEA